MGAIQSAINQGVTTAAVLGQLSGVPELRKASRLQKSIIEGAHRITDKGEAAFSQEEFELKKLERIRDDFRNIDASSLLSKH